MYSSMTSETKEINLVIEIVSENTNTFIRSKGIDDLDILVSFITFSVFKQQNTTTTYIIGIYFLFTRFLMWTRVLEKIFHLEEGVGFILPMLNTQTHLSICVCVWPPPPGMEKMTLRSWEVASVSFNSWLKSHYTVNSIRTTINTSTHHSILSFKRYP